MKPCYALLSWGSYMALHTATYFCVGADLNLNDKGSYDVIADDVCLYTWSAYPEPYTGGGTSGETGNEVAAREILSRLMTRLAVDLGGIVVMDDLAGEVAFDLGLETAAP